MLPKISGKVWIVLIAIIMGLSVTVNYDLKHLSRPGAVIPFENANYYRQVNNEWVETTSLTLQIQQLVQNAHVHGLAVSVISNYKPVYQEYFGWENIEEKSPLYPGTVFYGASFSKIVFAYLVMSLVDDGILDLDQPLETYLNAPLGEIHSNFWERFWENKQFDFRELLNHPAAGKITARMCLSHTSGLPNWRWIEDDKKLKIKYEPGTRYSYSGEGMLLLQYIIEYITGKDLETLAKNRVFKPINLVNSSFVWQSWYRNFYCQGHNQADKILPIHRRNYPNAAGSLSTTLEDMTKFYLHLLSLEDLTNESYGELFKEQIRITSKQQFGPNARIDAEDNDIIALSYGLGFGIYQTPYGRAYFKEGHDDGWQHYSVAFPDQGIALILMSNSDNGESIFKELIETTIGNYYTPWYWENYIPYDQ